LTIIPNIIINQTPELWEGYGWVLSGTDLKEIQEHEKKKSENFNKWVLDVCGLSEESK